MPKYEANTQIVIDLEPRMHYDPSDVEGCMHVAFFAAMVGDLTGTIFKSFNAHGEAGYVTDVYDLPEDQGAFEVATYAVRGDTVFSFERLT